MKKISLILSLVLFMFLGGCLSKKTEQQLSEENVPNVIGETTYTTKTAVTTPQTTYQASYFEFKYPTDTTNLNDGVSSGVVSGAETITVLPKAEKTPIIKVTSYENKTISTDTEIKALAVEKISANAVVKETAKGKINFDISGQGTYSLGTITDGGVVYYYYGAQVTKSLIKSGATEATNFTYLIRVILKSNGATELRYFEDIVKSLAAKEKTQTNVNKDLELEKALFFTIKQYESKLLVGDDVKALAEKNIEAVYNYVENNNKYVPVTIVGQENRRSAAMKFINTWVIDGDGTIGTKLKNLLGRLETAYRDQLGGEIATANALLKKADLHVFKLSNIDSLKDVIEKMINKRIQQEVISGYDFGQKINKDIAIENLRQKYDYFIPAINLIVNHYVESIRVDGLGRDSVPSSGTTDANYVWTQYEPINYTLPIMENAIDYQQYLEVELGDINIMKLGGTSEIAAREHVRKQAIESLKGNTSKIGFNKTGDSAYSLTQQIVKNIFSNAIDSVKDKRLQNLKEENKDFFIKTNTAETIDKVDKNELVNSKNKIELTLFNMVKFVKMFDSNVSLTNSAYVSIDTVKDNIISVGNLSSYKGLNPTDDYITKTKLNYTSIVLEWNSYYVNSADTILKYFDSSYKLDNN